MVRRGGIESGERRGERVEREAASGRRSRNSQKQDKRHGAKRGGGDLW
jgi:hypothetical protein